MYHSSSTINGTASQFRSVGKFRSYHFADFPQGCFPGPIVARIRSVLNHAPNEISIGRLPIAVVCDKKFAKNDASLCISLGRNRTRYLDIAIIRPHFPKWFRTSRKVYPSFKKLLRGLSRPLLHQGFSSMYASLI